MAPCRSERRQERFILVHILMISVLVVLGLWGFFGVISPPGEWITDHWCRCYWDSRKEAEQFRALEHLLQKTGSRVERTFHDALDGRSIRRLAARGYEVHRKSPLVE
jgi:hypothetical protein